MARTQGIKKRSSSRSVGRERVQFSQRAMTSKGIKSTSPSGTRKFPAGSVVRRKQGMRPATVLGTARMRDGSERLVVHPHGFPERRTVPISAVERV